MSDLIEKQDLNNATGAEEGKQEITQEELVTTDLDDVNGGKGKLTITYTVDV